MMMDSFLSAKVQTLFAKTNSGESAEQVYLKEQEGVFVLDDSSISDKLLRHFDLDKRDDKWYLDILQNLSPVFSECLNALTSQEFDISQIESKLFGWISTPNLFYGNPFISFTN
jgi:hypothetical protein